MPKVEIHLQVAFDVEQANDQPLLLDSTKAPDGDKKRWCNLNLGLSIQKRSWVNDRPQLKVAPVYFGVGESWSKTGQALTEVHPARLVFDGDEGLINSLEDRSPNTLKQRGICHLITQLFWPLWEDGLNKAQATVWMRRLGKIIYHPRYDVRRSGHELENLITQLRQEGLPHAAKYLDAAAPYAFTYREHPDGMFFDWRRLEPCAISSTSPLERQMREINRRTDVGARWTVPGVENLIGLDLVRRFDPEQWQTLWHLPQQAITDFIVKLQVRTKAEPPPDVKTT